jgi:hypothetical protein
MLRSSVAVATELYDWHSSIVSLSCLSVKIDLFCQFPVLVLNSQTIGLCRTLYSFELQHELKLRFFSAAYNFVVYEVILYLIYTVSTSYDDQTM